MSRRYDRKKKMLSAYKAGKLEEFQRLRHL